MTSLDAERKSEALKSRPGSMPEYPDEDATLPRDIGVVQVLPEAQQPHEKVHETLKAAPLNIKLEGTSADIHDSAADGAKIRVEQPLDVLRVEETAALALASPPKPDGQRPSGVTSTVPPPTHVVTASARGKESEFVGVDMEKKTSARFASP